MKIIPNCHNQVLRAGFLLNIGVKKLDCNAKVGLLTTKFNENVPLKTETPAFAKQVLPEVRQ